jgi:glycosyltransferase involved in cell wall biosynthesis
MHPIDIAVPCYNYSRYLRECVDSILGQDGCLVRILIIDDASSDGSVEVARDLAARDSRVELITHADNKGHITTFNEGIAWARQTYFLLLSADDVLAPGALKRAADLLEANPDVAFVHGCAVCFWGEVPPVKTGVAPTPPRIVPGPQFIGDICANPVNPVAAATAVVRTSVQKKVGLYKHALPHAGDLEMWLRCAMCGDVGEIGNIQGFRRMHDSNMFMLYAADGLMIRDFTQRYQTFQIFFAEHGHDLYGEKQLRMLANHQLADQIINEAKAQFRKKRLYSSLQLLQFAFQVAPGIVLNGQWWLRVAKWVWHRARLVLANIKRRLSALLKRVIH